MKSLCLLLAAGVSVAALASAAHAADLIVEAPEMPGVVDVSGSWDGAFVGVFAGYGWGELGFEGDPGVDVQPEGWLLGVNAGANFTLTDGIVAGIVGDIAWADLNTSVDVVVPVAGTIASSIDWQGSIRGRLGFDGGAFLPYVTAGLAFAHHSIDIDAGLASATDDQVHVGWTAGAGVEFAVAENISIDALYRYSDYGTKTYEADIGDTDISLTAHQVSVGLNFGF